MKRYDLVSIRSYNGVENGAYSWTFLSYAIMKRKLNGQMVCLRDESKTYDYISEDVDRDSLGYGEIFAFPVSEDSFENLRFKSKIILERYMKNSKLYFNDDTKYAKDVESNKKEKVM